jgi:hypothetical protein
MGLLRRLKMMWSRMQERPRAVATFDDQGASCRRPDGTVESVAWDDLRLIEIRTTDVGPFLEDVFLVLHATESGCVVPQEAEGFVKLVEYLQQWPGFDHKTLISAMTCTDNASFVCWRRGDA